MDYIVPKKRKEVPNPAGAKGASRTRDSMRQPLVSDDADWAQRTNLVSIQGSGGGRVLPAASQMNKAASHTAGPSIAKLASTAWKRYLDEAHRAGRGGELGRRLTALTGMKPKTLADNITHHGRIDPLFNFENTVRRLKDAVHSHIEARGIGSSYSGKSGVGYGNAPIRASKMTLKTKVTEPTTKTAGVMALGGKYPLDSYADIRAAVDYFKDAWTSFDPVERHIFCVKTASAARSIGLDIPELMERYGSMLYANDVDAHIASRKANLEKNAHPIYDALLEKQAELHPEQFADLMAKADIATGLNWYWGGAIADPWYATFGGQPETPVVKVANVEIAEDRLQELADSGALEGVFEKDLVAGFKKDPIAIFESLPADAKQIIANMV